MRFAATCRVLSLALCLIAACWGTPAGAQHLEMEQALQEFAHEIGTYIATVRFDESDIDSFVAGWPEVSSIFEDGPEGADDDSMAEVVEQLRSLMGLIQDASNQPEYRAWAAGNGVEADEWMRKAMRILMLSQQYGVAMQRDEMDIGAQIAEIEARRDDYGDKAADESIEAMRALESYFSALEQVGTPTDDERSLLDEHWPRLATVVDADAGGGDDWADDEWADDDWGDYDEGEDGIDIDIDLPDGALPFDPEGTSYGEFFYGSSYLRKGAAAATVESLLASTDRHCYLEDQGMMPMDDGDTTIYTVYCLTHPGEMEEGDDILALTVMEAPDDLVGEVFGRPESGWSTISADRWVEEY